MKARLYRPEDREALIDIHRRQSIKLTGSAEGMFFCDPEDKEQILTVVVEDAAGVPVAFAHSRIVIDGSLTLDPHYGTPQERLAAVEKVIASSYVKLKELGASTWITRSLAGERFARRLQKLGFKKEVLPVLSLDIQEAAGKRP